MVVKIYVVQLSPHLWDLKPTASAQRRRIIHPHDGHPCQHPCQRAHLGHTHGAPLTGSQGSFFETLAKASQPKPLLLLFPRYRPHTGPGPPMAPLLSRASAWTSRPQASWRSTPSQDLASKAGARTGSWKKSGSGAGRFEARPLYAFFVLRASLCVKTEAWNKVCQGQALCDPKNESS